MCNIEIFTKKERKKETDSDNKHGYQGRRVKRNDSEGSLDPLT